MVASIPYVSLILSNRFRSLRVRLLLPLLAVALLASLAVALGSYALGDRWARDQVMRRYGGIESTLSQGTFPLTGQVVTLISELTDTELVTLDARQRVIQSTLTIPRGTRFSELTDAGETTEALPLTAIQGQSYRYRVFQRLRPTTDGATSVAVLFDEAAIESSRRRAASLPLAAGLSTIVLLTSVTLLLASRLIRRLSTLEQQVNRVAEGDFATHVPTGADDEVGRLGTAVSDMSDQLQQMWTTLERQQGQKLLHQVAGGLAHQLRNSITGARMAVELHTKHCGESDDESMSVALAQLEQTEGHVRRLLTVASGKQEADQPQCVNQCLADARATLSATASHLNIELTWHIDDQMNHWKVADGPSLQAAVTNLVLNAIQEGTEVEVSARVQTNPPRLRVDVIDNGDGPAAEVADNIFDPFVTSKPEGLGLGLPLVARSAKRLGGEVIWERDQERTRFTVTAQVTANDSND